MTIQSFDVASFEKELGYKVIVGRLYREVEMLRRHIAPVIGDVACPICFRTFPHAGEIHLRDLDSIRSLPKIEVSGHGYHLPETREIDVRALYEASMIPATGEVGE